MATDPFSLIEMRRWREPTWSRKEPPPALQRYVACLDILGTKRLLNGPRAPALVAAFTRAVRELRRHEGSVVSQNYPILPAEYAEDEGNPEGAIAFVDYRQVSAQPLYPRLGQVVIFSDSIFAFSQGDTPTDLADLADYTHAVFWLFFNERLPLRGAVGRGACVVWPEANLYVGQGIVAAYELAESIDAIGVVIHPDLGPFRPGQSPVTVPIKLPAKDGKAAGTTSLPCHVPSLPDDLHRRVQVPAFESCLAAMEAEAGPHRAKYEHGRPLLAAMRHAQA